MATKKVSRAEAKRLAAQQAEPRQLSPMRPGLQTTLDNYQPADADPAAWAAVAATHAEVMTRSGFTSASNFSKHLGVVAAYLLWRHARHQDISIPSAFTYSAIDAFYLHGMGDMKPTTRNDYRSRLYGLAPKVNDSLVTPTKYTLGYQPVRPGYTAAEEAAIRRVVLRQRLPVTRRQMCAIVGFGAGAGLDGQDLRHLRRRHITITDAGILVEVPGKRARLTVVRAEYEPLVLAAIEGLQPSTLLLGREATRKNVTPTIINRAELFGDVPRIDVSRLRSTWLSWLLVRRVPLQLIMQASGLQTARSLIDLLAHLPAVADHETGELLRGGAS